MPDDDVIPAIMPKELGAVDIPELIYVEESDYDDSDSQIPVFNTFWDGAYFSEL